MFFKGYKHCRGRGASPAFSGSRQGESAIRFEKQAHCVFVLGWA